MQSKENSFDTSELENSTDKKNGQTYRMAKAFKNCIINFLYDFLIPFGFVILVFVFIYLLFFYANVLDSKNPTSWQSFFSCFMVPVGYSNKIMAFSLFNTFVAYFFLRDELP